MADPEISQTNFIPLHQPQSFTSLSSYDPETSTDNSSFEESIGDDEDSSLSGLEEACSTLQIDTDSGSSTESLEGPIDSPRHHHNQPPAEPTDAGINNITPLNHRALIDMRQLNADIERNRLASSSDTDSLMVTMAPLDNISQAFSMVAVCDTALRYHPPPGIDGLVMAPAASNGTQSHTMATLPARTIKEFVQNYEDMPAAVRTFIQWLLSHEGRRFYFMNPMMAGYIEGTTKYDMLTAIIHYQHDISRRLCSTSMFSLSICISLSEHHHWIHASNSLCSFLAGEYAFAAPPDSSIIDSDAVAFRTMNYRLALERGEIDYDSEGDFFNSFCDFNDDPEIPELEEFTDEDEIPEMEDLSLRTRAPDYSTRHNYRRCSTSSESSDDPYAIFDTTFVDNVEYNLEGESHNSTRTSASYIGAADATRKLSEERKLREAVHSIGSHCCDHS